MSFQGIAPIAFDGVSMVTTALGSKDGELGTRRVVDGREYVLVYNDGGASVPVGCGVVPAAGSSNFSITVTAATSADAVIGICRNATITTAAYAWVVVNGYTTVQMMATSGTVTTGGLIEIAGNGYFAPVSLTTGNKAPAIGKALNTIASSGSGDAYVRCF